MAAIVNHTVKSLFAGSPIEMLSPVSGQGQEVR